MWHSVALLFQNDSCIYLKQLSAQTWGIVSILQEASGFRRRGAGYKKTRALSMRGPTRCGTCAALNKAAQPIHCACNQFIHPYRHTGKRDTQAGRWEGERATDVETEERISLSRYVSLEVSVIKVSPQSVQLQIGLPPLPQLSGLSNPPMMYHYHNFG